MSCLNLNIEGSNRRVCHKLWKIKIQYVSKNHCSEAFYIVENEKNTLHFQIRGQEPTSFWAQNEGDIQRILFWGKYAFLRF